MQRRQFLARSVKLALGASAASLLNGAFAADAVDELAVTNFNDDQVRTLAAMARALLPHEQLADDHYLGVVPYIDALAQPQREVITRGLATMDAAADGRWLKASVDTKLEILESLQETPFFTLMLTASIDVIYRHPEVWRLVGYEGSSIEHGGYLNRGFDDIDWLP